MNPIRRIGVRILSKLPKPIRLPIQVRLARKARKPRTKSKPLFLPERIEKRVMLTIAERMAEKESAARLSADKKRIKSATNADIARRLLRRHLLNGIAKKFGLTKEQETLLSQITMHRDQQPIPGTNVPLRVHVELLTLKLVNTFPPSQDRRTTLELLRAVTQNARTIQQESLKHSKELRTDTLGNVATKVGKGFEYLEMQAEFSPTPKQYAAEMQNLIGERRKQLAGISSRITIPLLKKATEEILSSERELDMYRRRHYLS